jgi:hypothetical protein
VPEWTVLKTALSGMISAPIQKKKEFCGVLKKALSGMISAPNKN